MNETKEAIERVRHTADQMGLSPREADRLASHYERLIESEHFGCEAFAMITALCVRMGELGLKSTHVHLKNTLLLLKEETRDETRERR